VCQCEFRGTPALSLKHQFPTERLAAQERDHEKLQRERQLRELAEETKGKDMAVMMGPWGAHAISSKQASSHSTFRPFLWGFHTELVKMASGKESVASLVKKAHMQALPIQPMGSLPSTLPSSSSSTAQAAAASRGGALEFTN